MNSTIDYFWYNPMAYIKAFIGLSRDLLINGDKIKNILKSQTP